MIIYYKKDFGKRGYRDLYRSRYFFSPSYHRSGKKQAQIIYKEKEV